MRIKTKVGTKRIYKYSVEIKNHWTKKIVYYDHEDIIIKPTKTELK